MTGRRTSARNLKNRNEMEAKETSEVQKEPLPEKRARTSTRSDEFDYSLIKRTRKSKKTTVEEANDTIQSKKGHQLELSALCQMNPVAAQKIAEKHDFKSGFRCPKCGRLFPLYQSLVSHYDECQVGDTEAEIVDKGEETVECKEEREDDDELTNEADKEDSDDIPISKALELAEIVQKGDTSEVPETSTPNEESLKDNLKISEQAVISDSVEEQKEDSDENESDDEDIARALGLRKILPRSESPKTPSPKKKLPEYHPKSNITFERSKSGKDYEKEDEVCPESVIYVPTPIQELSPCSSPERSPTRKPKATNTQGLKRKRKLKAFDSDKTCPEGYVACKLCYEFFPTEESLNAHERSKHPDVLSYQCTICNYCSLEKSLMTRHMRTHSGQRPYNCSVCGYAFTTKANCERHIRKRHELTDRGEIEKLIQFDEKQQKNECEQSWKLTQKTVCMHCDAKFGDFWSLRDHLKIHDKRSFYCSTCQAAFSCRSNCIAHIMQKHSIIDREIAAEMVHFDTDLSKVPKGGRISFRGKTGLKISKNRRKLKRQEIPNSDEEDESHADGDQASEKATVTFPYKCAICKNGFHDFKLVHDHIKYRHWTDFKNFVKTNILFSENISNETFNKLYEGVKDADNYEQQIVRPSPIWCRSEVKNYIRKKRPKGNHVHILKDSSLHSIMRNLQNHRERTMKEAPFHPLTISDLNQLQTQKLANVEYVEVYDKDGNPPKQLAVVKNIVAPNLVTTQSEGSTPKVIYQSDEPATSKESTVTPSQVKSVSVKQVNRKNPSMGNGPIPTINGIDYYQEAPARPIPVAAKGRLIYNLAIKPAPEKSTSANFEKATTLFKTKTIVKSDEPQLVEIQPAQKKKVSVRKDAKVQFTVKTNGQTFKLTEKESRKNLAKPGVFVPLDTTSIPITQTTRVESASVYVPTKVVNYEEVYTDEISQTQRSAKGTSDQTILKVKSVTEIRPKGFRKGGNPDKNQDFPRICPKCGKSFPWASSLRRHLLTHSGLKPYCCSMCKVTFTTKSNLERHVLRRHGIFDREAQAACVIKLSKEEAMQAAAEREAKEPNLNECPENDDSIEETVDDTFHVNNRIEDDMDHQVLVPVTDELIEEEIVDSSFMVQTTQ